MSRLHPESSSKIPSERDTHRESEHKGKCQEHLRDSCTEFEECWDGKQKLTQTDMDHFLGGGVSAAYRETHPSYKINEVVNTFTTTCVDSMLLGFKEGNDQGNSVDEIDSFHSSNMFHDRNLLTWNNDLCDYSPEYRTSSNIFKNEFNDQFHKGYDSELPTICYDRFADNCLRRNCLEFKDERPVCKLDRTAPNIWCPVSFEMFGSSASGNLRDSAELDEFTDNCRRSCIDYRDDRSDCKLDSGAPDSWPLVSFERYGSSAPKETEIRGEHNPLLLPWHTDDTNMNALTHLTDMDHEVCPLPSWTEEDDHSLDCSTSSDIYPSIFPSSSMLLDHRTQRCHWLQKKDTVAKSSYAPLTLLYDPESPNSDDAGIVKDVFRGSRFYVVGEKVVPAVGALLITQGLDFDLGLKSKSLSDCIDQQYDILTNDAHQLLRHEKGLEMPQLEEFSLVNVDIPAQREVSFPLQLRRIRWLDTAVETNYDGLQIATLNSLM